MTAAEKVGYTMVKTNKHLSADGLLITNPCPFEFAEAYKAMRTNLQFLLQEGKSHKLIVTSSIAGEGKSTVSVNLAASLAAGSGNVLLVDADLRKPHIHRYLDVGNTIGLTTAVAGRVPLERAIVYLRRLNIYVLTSGPVPREPAELLGSEKMADLVRELGERFDIVLFDTPPVSIVTDASVLSRFADGVLLVVRQNYTDLPAALAAKKNLAGAGAKIIGCVFNAFDYKRSNQYYSYSDYKKNYRYYRQDSSSR